MPPHRHSLVSVIALLLFVHTGLAQPRGDGDPKSPSEIKPTNGAATGVITLADEPYRLDAVGLSIRIPVGCQVKSNRIADRETAQIVPEGSTNWIINIQTPTTSVETPDIPAALKRTIDLIKGSYSIYEPEQKGYYDETVQAKIIEQIKDLKLPGGPAARLYVSTPIGNKARLAKGYTIFQPQPKQFVVLEFVCHENDFGKFRGMYETIVGTALFEKSDALAMARGAAVKTGTAFVNSLSEQDYVAAMGSDKEVWYRIFKPGKTGTKMDDTEIGYKGLRFWKGKRGEINPGKPRSSWKSAEEQEGYLAQIRSRVIWDGKILDTQAIYFMTPDRNEEAWTIALGVKEATGQTVSDATETGARIKNEMRILKSEAKKQPVTLNPPILGEGYISQFETLLMPRLIVLHKNQAELGFYCWQNHSGSDTGTISFRKDNLSVQGSLYALTTNLRDDSSPQVSTYTEAGELVHSDLPQGLVCEPVDLTALKRLWQQKNLPVNH